MITKKFDVGGMTCSACQARVERAVKGVAAVKDVSVSLLLGEMSVTLSTEDDVSLVIKAVQDAGYTCKLSEKSNKSEPISRLSPETSGMIKRLVPSAVILILLMYVSMGHMIGMKLPSFLAGAENAFLNAAVQAALALSVMAINGRFFINGFKNLFKLSPNMDSLVAMGSGASFIYSAYVGALIYLALLGGDKDLAAKLLPRPCPRESAHSDVRRQKRSRDGRKVPASGVLRLVARTYRRQKRVAFADTPEDMAVRKAGLRLLRQGGAGALCAGEKHRPYARH